MKTNKSLKKRMKLTKTGKIKTRRPGKNHFNAKESRNKQMGNKRQKDLHLKNKDRARYLPGL